MQALLGVTATLCLAHCHLEGAKLSPELVASVASVAVALAAMVFTTFLLSRQVRQMEHERNALAILEAIKRLTDPQLVEIFARLRGINERYPSDDDIRERYPTSRDAADYAVVGQWLETIAALARRGVIDPSLLADALGFSLRRYWDTIRVFIARRRTVEANAYLAENFEWLAMYSAWWKDIPRSSRDANYRDDQFAGVEFKA